MRYIFVFLCCCRPLWALLSDGAIVLTKSYLDSQLEVGVAGQSSGHAVGHVALSSALCEEWEFGVELQERSFVDWRGELRAERQLASDLEGNLCGVTGYCSLAMATKAGRFSLRETGGAYAEAGIGVGRHLCIYKGGYTQLFSYMYHGIDRCGGNTNGCTIGTVHTMSYIHRLQGAFSYVRSSSFRSYYDLSVIYAYIFANGFTGSMQLTYTRAAAHREATVRCSVSCPIVF